MKVGQLSLNGCLVVYTHNAEGNAKIGEYGNLAKSYRITPAIFNKIASSAIRQFKERHNKLTFLTFTFPDDISEQLANVGMSRFLDNFKKTYELRSYIWTKELTRAGRPHFHAICDFPYQPIHEINDAWCSAIGMGSNCAVRLPPDGAVVKNMHTLMRYMCKYVTKSFNTRYESRCYSISRNILSKPVTITPEGIQSYMDNVDYKTIAMKDNFAIYHTKKIEENSEIIEYLQKNFSDFENSQIFQ